MAVKAAKDVKASAQMAVTAAKDVKVEVINFKKLLNNASSKLATTI
jgi:hypothetical protein